GWSVENAYRWLLANGLHGASTVLLQINEHDLNQPYVDSSILDKNVSFPTQQPALALYEIQSRYILPKLGLSAAGDPGSKGAAAYSQEAVAGMLSAVKAVHTLASAQQA